MRVWHGGVHIHEHWLFQDTKNHSVFEGELTHTDPDMVDLFINVVNVFIFFEHVTCVSCACRPG